MLSLKPVYSTKLTPENLIQSSQYHFTRYSFSKKKQYIAHCQQLIIYTIKIHVNTPYKTLHMLKHINMCFATMVLLRRWGDSNRWLNYYRKLRKRGTIPSSNADGN